MQKYQLFINNEWVEAASGERFESLDPFSGDAWASLPRATRADVDKAVKAAKKAFATWSQTSREERLDVLNRILA